MPDTWLVYEELFDNWDNAKEALNNLQTVPDWLRDVSLLLRTCGRELTKYYNKMAKPFAYVDATLLHPALKKKFIKKAGYGADLIEEYVKGMESRFQTQYDPTKRIPRPSRPLQHGKRRRPSTSDSDSSDGTEYNEFTGYMGLKRDSSVTDPLN